MPSGETIALTIDHVGVRGDGVATWNGETIYIPFTAPGDQVRAKLGAKQGEGRAAALIELVSPGARAKPVCRHFGECGGCALQHLDEAAYIAAKTQWVQTALTQQRLTPGTVAPMRRFPPGIRRRARFQLNPAGTGFHARASHRIVDLKECAVLHPRLVALVPALRQAAKLLTPPGTHAAANATLAENGIDLLLDLPAVPNLPQLEALAEFARAQDLARISWRRRELITPAAIGRKPVVTLSGVAVELPEDAFLQPSLEVEASLTAAVIALAGKARAIADLYAGIGTFTFALARQRKVHAVEGAESAVAAINRAAAQAGLAAVVSTETRDLARRPLDEGELARFDLVVFDPPYAGAAEQAHALAASQVPRIIAVSCNPASFARDARLLVDGGYRLVEVRPFDSFIWSANLELVALFERR